MKIVKIFSDLVCVGLAGVALVACQSESNNSETTTQASPLSVSPGLDLQAQEGDIDVGGADFGGGLISNTSSKIGGIKGKISLEELEHYRAIKEMYDIVDGNVVDSKNWRDRLINSVKNVDESTFVRIFLELQDVSFPWHE